MPLGGRVRLVLGVDQASVLPCGFRRIPDRDERRWPTAAHLPTIAGPDAAEGDMTGSKSVTPTTQVALRQRWSAWRRATVRPSRGARTGRGEASLVAGVLLVAGTAYAWDLDRQGWANAYYAAAAQAGASSWSSFFFGSLETGNAVSTDKPPTALWLMSLSLHLFGRSSWALMLPQVVEALAAVFVLYRTVRLLAGRGAALVSGLVLATTPVFLVLARFNDPDMLLTALTVSAAYCTVRAARSPSRGWLVCLGGLLGLAFMTKWVAGLLPAPAMAAALVRSLPRRRVEHARRLAVVALTAAVSGSWWVVAVLSTPSRSRPYADGSRGGLLNLIVGQDGLSRLGSGRMNGPNPVGGAPGLLRLLVQPFSGQIGWLLPAAVAALALPVVLRRCPSLGYVLFGGWFAATALVFSLMAGSLHPYYAVLLAPAVAALVGMGAADLWHHRRHGSIAAVVVLTAGYGAHLAAGYPFAPRWLPATVLGCAAAVGCAYAADLAGRRRLPLDRVHPALSAVAAVATAGSLLLGPATFALTTLTQPITGADPLAGPAPRRAPASYPAALVAFLQTHRHGATWVAAVPTATPASRLQLQSSEPVLPLGGFTGHTQSPTLSQVQQWVQHDMLRYLVLAGPYTADPVSTPVGLRGSTTENVVSWARSHGCVVLIPGVHLALINLRGPCHPSRH